MTHLLLPDKPIKKNPMANFAEWIKPVGYGRFGLSFSFGSKEVFIGVTLAKIEREIIVRRRKAKALVRSHKNQIIDL